MTIAELGAVMGADSGALAGDCGHVEIASAPDPLQRYVFETDGMVVTEYRAGMHPQVGSTFRGPVRLSRPSSGLVRRGLLVRAGCRR